MRRSVAGFGRGARRAGASGRPSTTARTGNESSSRLQRSEDGLDHRRRPRAPNAVSHLKAGSALHAARVPVGISGSSGRIPRPIGSARRGRLSGVVKLAGERGRPARSGEMRREALDLSSCSRHHRLQVDHELLIDGVIGGAKGVEGACGGSVEDLEHG